MAFPTATTSASDAASGESTINDLLSVGLEDNATETEVQDGGDTPVTEPETEVQDEPETEVVEGDETQPETEEESDGGSEEQESTEEEFNLDELETDFADSAYASAAKHYSKQFGKELDPNDQADRAILRELMERGRKISELQTKEPEEEAEEATEQPTAETKQPVRTPEEMLQERITGVRTYAKEAYNPVIAKEIVLPLLQGIAEFFYPGKGMQVLGERTPEQLQAVTQALSAGMAMSIADAIPQIVAATPKAVEAQFPHFSKMHEMAQKEAAVDEILDAVGTDGKEVYPGFDKLVESGAINRALQSAELKNAQFDRDPFKNRVAKLKFAYKLARGERVDPQTLAKAAQRGRASERERQQRVATGRTSPGSSSRGATQTRSTLLGQLVGGGESRSAQLFKNVGRRQQE